MDKLWKGGRVACKLSTDGLQEIEDLERLTAESKDDEELLR